MTVPRVQQFLCCTPAVTNPGHLCLSARWRYSRWRWCCCRRRGLCWRRRWRGSRGLVRSGFPRPCFLAFSSLHDREPRGHLTSQHGTNVTAVRCRLWRYRTRVSGGRSLWRRTWRGWCRNSRCRYWHGGCGSWCGYRVSHQCPPEAVRVAGHGLPVPAVRGA